MSEERPAETHVSHEAGESLRLAPRYSDAEFDARVDAAVKVQVENLLPELMARLAAAQAQTAAPGSDKPGDFVSALALQLAELTGQGTGRIYVAPEIVEKRRRALGRLQELILDLWSQSDRGRNKEYVPAYKLIGKVYLNLGMPLGEVLIDPLYRDNQKLVQSTEIDWPGIPNPLMEPINEPAKAVYKIFCEWTGINGPAEADPLQALTAQGAVVRGKAASVLLKGGARNMGAGDQEPTAPEFTEDGDMVPTAAIRRHDRAPTTKVQVLGTLTKPVEVS
ncbi:MAG TPA: hypothetical protein VKS24_24985 [Bradyrhizobium sp.]|nr:hypothetical protein [Bradyrhizobium sp.]